MDTCSLAIENIIVDINGIHRRVLIVAHHTNAPRLSEGTVAEEIVTDLRGTTLLEATVLNEYIGTPVIIKLTILNGDTTIVHLETAGT